MTTTGVAPGQRVDAANRYLIIAGAYKSGTTSLYMYLRDHPQVCASERKETWFFSPRELHPHIGDRYEGDLSPYLAGFHGGDTAKLRVEGTPFYLYSAQTAAWIHQALPQSRIVVTLGDPVWRMRSWYQMAATYGYFDPVPGFDAYLRTMQEDPRPPEERPPHLRCLEHGRYAPYLKEYLRVFGRERVLVLWFDELTQRPAQALRRLCEFAGLDPAFYDRYQFKVHHPALELKREKLFLLYAHGKNWLSARLPLPHPRPWRLRRLRESLDRKLVPLLFQEAERIQLAPETVRQLRAYYAADAAELEQLLGERPPWAAAEPA